MADGGNNGAAARRNGRGDERRERRRVEAQAHTIEMDERLSGEIDRAVRATTFYDKVPALPEGRATRVPRVTVAGQDSVSAILEGGRGRAELCDMAVLDFASFTHPGGGYERGTMAQEQALCAESFLYNVLSRFDGWYRENRRRNINCELYRDRAMVVPAVRFERGRYHSYADVIVAAAPNARRARSDYRVPNDTLEGAMRDRVRLVLAIADSLGREKLVLGAFGCGAFGWDPQAVSRIMLEELASGAHVASEVTLAVPDGRHDENLEVFRHAFACFPEPNIEPYTAPLPIGDAPVVEGDSDDEEGGAGLAEVPLSDSPGGSGGPSPRAAGVGPALALVLRVSWPIMLSYVAVGLPCGVLAAKAGMAPWMSFLVAVTCVTGAGQFMISNMLIAGLPLASVIASVVAVGTRFALYSASIAPYLRGESRARSLAVTATLTEEAFGISLGRLAADDGWGARHTLLLNLSLIASWSIACGLGAAIGAAVDVPTAIASFTVTSMFAYLLVSQLVPGRSVVAATAAALVVVACKALGLAAVAIPVAAVLGVACGMLAPVGDGGRTGGGGDVA